MNYCICYNVANEVCFIKTLSWSELKWQMLQMLFFYSTLQLAEQTRALLALRRFMCVCACVCAWWRTGFLSCAAPQVPDGWRSPGPMRAAAEGRPPITRSPQSVDKSRCVAYGCWVDHQLSSRLLPHSHLRLTCTGKSQCCVSAPSEKKANIYILVERRLTQQCDRQGSAGWHALLL